MNFKKKYLEVLFLILTLTVLTGCDDDLKDVKPDDILALDSSVNLREYLSGSKYLSKTAQEVGVGPDGVIYGKWSIQFGTDTFEWHYSDVSEQGTYTYLGKDIMSVTVGNTSFSSAINTSTSELEWDGLTYVRSVE